MNNIASRNGLRLTTDTNRSFFDCTAVGSPLLVVIAMLLLVPSSAAQPFNFTKVETDLARTNFSHMVLGDIDRDGQIDVVQSGSTSNSGPHVPGVVTSRNLGEADASGIRTQLFESAQLGSGLWLGPVELIDFNADGVLDVFAAGASAVSEPFAAGTGLFLGDGDGGFTEFDIDVQPRYSGSASWADFDGDGDLDLLLTGVDDDGDYGSILYQNDGGALTEYGTTLPGIAFGDSQWGDVDNDGDLDLILVGATISGDIISDFYLNDGSGQFTPMNAGLAAPVFASVDLGDFDADGDLDVAIGGGYASALLFSGQIAIYRNDGTSFTQVANLEGGFYGKVQWGDHDNNGLLDVLSIGRISATGKSIARIYHVGDGGEFTNHVNLPGLSFSSAGFADLDTDGDLDIVTSGLGVNDAPASMVFRNDNLLHNARPSAPTGLTSSSSDGIVTIRWQPGADELTPSAGLSYDVRIGSAPGLADVRSPGSDPSTGVRFTPRRGVAGVSTSQKLALSPGTYYWSVQAVDNSFLGSAFAPEQSFVVVSQDVQTGVDPAVSVESKVLEPYPNPSESGITIPYQVRADETGTLTIYSALGQRVATRTLDATSGIEEYYWDGLDASRTALASGIYFVRFQTSSVTETKTVVIVR